MLGSGQRGTARAIRKEQGRQQPLHSLRLLTSLNDGLQPEREPFPLYWPWCFTAALEALTKTRSTFQPPQAVLCTLRALSGDPP